MKNNLATDGLHAFVFGVCWWVLLFSYHLFIKIPHEIRSEAGAARAPLLRVPAVLTVPPLAYSHTKLPQLPPQAPIWTSKSPEPKTIEALYAQDFPTTMKISDEGIGIEWKDIGMTIKLKRQLYLDFPGKQKFVGFYLPSSGADLTRTPEACVKVVKGGAVQQAIDYFSKQQIFMLGGPMQGRGSGSVPFSGKVLIYHEDVMSVSQKATVVKAFAALHYEAMLMGPEYLQKRVSAWQRKHNVKPRHAQAKPS